MGTKACIACAEQIHDEARLCRFCRTRQDDQSFLPGKGGGEQEASQPETATGEFEPFVDKSTEEFTVCSSCGHHCRKGYFRCSKCDGLLDHENGFFQVNSVEGGVQSKDIPGALASEDLAATPGIAIAAIICAFLIPVLGLVLGYTARSEVRNPKRPTQGAGLATGAIFIGWLWIVVLIVWAIIFALVAGGTSSGY